MSSKPYEVQTLVSLNSKFILLLCVLTFHPTLFRDELGLQQSRVFDPFYPLQRYNLRYIGRKLHKQKLSHLRMW